MKLRAAALIALAAMGAAVHADAANTGETDWAGAAFGADVAGPSADADVTTDDLLRLRDIGGLSLSPDGRRLAFPVRQAVPERNNYVVRWFVVATDARSAAPVALPVDGGQPIPLYAYGLPQAYVMPEAAKWSPDGSTLAFRRMEDHRVDLWTIELASGRSIRVNAGGARVTAFAWNADGSIVYRTGLNYDRYRKNVLAEARHGWLVDARIPRLAARVSPTEPDCAAVSDPACEIRTVVVTRDGESREARGNEADALADVDPRVDVRADGAIARLENADGARFKGWRPVSRVVTTAHDAVACRAPACTGQFISSLGWARDGATIWFLKRESGVGQAEGAPADQTALYEWRPGSASVRKVLRGDDLVQACVVREATAYCIRQRFDRPAHIVAIDLNRGAVRVIADPNPTFARKVLPCVRKIPFVDDEGTPGYAHFIYPKGYSPGSKSPLVITLYRSEGFLRGNTGGEYPIYPMAANGLAVLSIEIPFHWAAARQMDGEAFEKWRYSENLRDRRVSLSAIEALVDGLVAEGLVDPHRVAITGLSAGAEIVHYALQRSQRFAAAIASSGIHDLTFFALIPPGSVRDQLMKAFGQDALTAREGSAVAGLSWSQMPGKLTTPLLINVGEYESMIGFEGIEALSHAGRPVETRIFPDESHVKYHPQSLAGVFDNNMMWLRFWLKGEEDARPELSPQYARWRQMRDRLDAEADATHQPAGGSRHK